MSVDPRRRTGRTRRQLRAAPRDAIYVWPVGRSLDYLRNLVRDLGRHDLKLVPLSWLREENVTGLRRHVVLDHACIDRMNDEQLRAWHLAQAAAPVAEQEAKVPKLDTATRLGIGVQFLKGRL